MTVDTKQPRITTRKTSPVPKIKILKPTHHDKNVLEVPVADLPSVETIGEIARRCLTDAPGGTIAVRHAGELEDRSFFLSDSYNWTIVQDSHGQLCLVPFSK